MSELKKANLLEVLEVSDIVKKREELALDFEREKKRKAPQNCDCDKRLKTIEDNQERIETKLDKLIAGTFLAFGFCDIRLFAVCEIVNSVLTGY